MQRRWPRRPAILRLLAGLTVMGLAGCGHALPIAATFRGETGVTADANLRGAVDVRLPPVEVKLPAAADPGEMVATVVRAGKGTGPHPRIALVDVDGLLLNQNYGSLYAVGDNPLASLRDKLDVGGARSRRSWRSCCGSTAPAAASRPATSWPRSSAGSRPRPASRSSPA